MCETINTSGFTPISENANPPVLMQLSPPLSIFIQSVYKSLQMSIQMQIKIKTSSRRHLELWQHQIFWNVKKFGNYVLEQRLALLGNKCYPYSDNI